MEKALQAKYDIIESKMNELMKLIDPLAYNGTNDIFLAALRVRHQKLNEERMDIARKIKAL